MPSVVFTRPDGPKVRIEVNRISSYTAVPPRGHPNAGPLDRGTRLRLSNGWQQDVCEMPHEVDSLLAQPSSIAAE